MKKKESAMSNTKIAIIFFIFLAFVVGVSLMFKAILVIRAGQFDDSRRFNLSISDEKNLEIISLSGSTKNIVIFKLPKNIRQDSAGRFLEIPIDGFITSKSLNINQNIDKLFLKAIFDYKSLRTNFTIIDLARIYSFVRTIPQSSINVKNISGDQEGADADRIVRRLVSDELIERDNQTIQIINGTNVSGLGNRLARLITNMGGDVIIVATSDILHKKSIISYIDHKTYTVERLSKILKYEIIKKSESVISDITIIIGEDSL